MRLFLGTFAKIYEYEKFQKEFNKHFDGNWTKEENLHTTIKFIGDIDDVTPIKEALSNITYLRYKRVEFNDLELFEIPNKILYCTTKSQELESLHNEVLNRLNFLDLESKEFIPHITLLRIKQIKDDSYKEYLKSFEDRKVGYLKLKLVLVKSTLTSNGPIYEIIEEF